MRMTPFTYEQQQFEIAYAADRERRRIRRAQLGAIKLALLLLGYLRSEIRPNELPREAVVGEELALIRMQLQQLDAATRKGAGRKKGRK